MCSLCGPIIFDGIFFFTPPRYAKKILYGPKAPTSEIRTPIIEPKLDRDISVFHSSANFPHLSLKTLAIGFDFLYEPFNLETTPMSNTARSFMNFFFLI